MLAGGRQAAEGERQAAATAGRGASPAHLAFLEVGIGAGLGWPGWSLVGVFGWLVD